jgi:SAM-dependent methyltransferase
MEALQPREELVLSLVKPKKSDTLLDIGCGGGAILRQIGECKKFGADIEPKDIPGVEVRFTDLNSGKLPFDESGFDWVVCTEVIEHLSNPDNLISEINRVLKPSGVLVLSTPNLASWVNRIKLLFGKRPGNIDVSLRRRDHVRVYTVGMLDELFKLYGLKRVGLLGAPPSRNANPGRKLIEKIPTLASYLIVVAETEKG